MIFTGQVDWLPNQGWDARIHVAANGELVNVFLVVTTRYLILVDTLINPSTAAELVSYAQPFMPGRQLLVINTHADWDHAWGNQIFAGQNAPFPAPIIAHQSNRKEYNRPENVDYLKQMKREQPDLFSDVTLTGATLTFADELWIDGGDLTLHLFPTPGHTTDHIALYLPEIRTLLAGDAAEIPFPIVYAAADLPIMRASLAKMAALQPAHALYCHAPPDTGPQLLHDNIAYYDALETVCRAALKNSLELEKVPDSELPGVLGCPFEAVAPTTGAWAEVSPNARTLRHGQQIRLILDWLAQTQRAEGYLS